MLLDALGMALNKDVFCSASVEPGNLYGSAVSEFPSRSSYCHDCSFHRTFGVGDPINYTNVERITRCCRQDRLILKPDRAITMN